jgi:hypothetical protein
MIRLAAIPASTKIYDRAERIRDIAHFSSDPQLRVLSNKVWQDAFQLKVSAITNGDNLPGLKANLSSHASDLKIYLRHTPIPEGEQDIRAMAYELCAIAEGEGEEEEEEFTFYVPPDLGTKIQEYAKTLREIGPGKFWDTVGKNFSTWAETGAGGDPEGLATALPGWNPEHVNIMLNALRQTRPEPEKAKAEPSFEGPSLTESREEQIVRNLLRKEPKVFFEKVEATNREGSFILDDEGQPVIVTRYENMKGVPEKLVPGIPEFTRIFEEGLKGIGPITPELIRSQIAVQEAREEAQKPSPGVMEGVIRRKLKKHEPAPEMMPWQTEEERPVEREDKSPRWMKGRRAQIRYDEGVAGQHPGWKVYMQSDPTKPGSLSWIGQLANSDRLGFGPEIQAPLSLDGAREIAKKWDEDWELAITDPSYVENNFKPFVHRIVLDPVYQADFDTASLPEQRKRLQQQKLFKKWQGWENIEREERDRLIQLVRNPEVGAYMTMTDKDDLSTMRATTGDMIGEAMDMTFGDIKEAVKILRDKYNAMTRVETEVTRQRIEARERRLDEARKMVDKAVEQKKKAPEKIDEEKLRTTFEEHGKRQRREEEVRQRAEALRKARESAARGEEMAVPPPADPTVGDRPISTILDDPHFSWAFASKIPELSDLVRPEGGWVETPDRVYTRDELFGGERFLSDVAGQIPEFKEWIDPTGRWKADDIARQIGETYIEGGPEAEARRADLRQTLETAKAQQAKFEAMKDSIGIWVKESFGEFPTEEELDAAIKSATALSRSRKKDPAGTGGKAWGKAVARVLKGDTLPAAKGKRKQLDPFIRESVRNSTMKARREEFNAMEREARQWVKDHINEGWTRAKGGSPPFNEVPKLSQLLALIKAAKDIKPWGKALAKTLVAVTRNDMRKAEKAEEVRRQEETSKREEAAAAMARQRAEKSKQEIASTTV